MSTCDDGPPLPYPLDIPPKLDTQPRRITDYELWPSIPVEPVTVLDSPRMPPPALGVERGRPGQ